MKLLTYLHDPDNLFIPLLKNTKFPDAIKGSIIAISPSTTPEIKSAVEKLGFKIIKGGTYGTARINVLKQALKENSTDYFFVCDFDKLLHWLSTDPKEFLEILNHTPNSDYTVIARSVRALTTYPETWEQTEMISTKILAKLIKQNIDLMNGPIILSKKAAQVISENAIEEGVGSCVEFCLLAYQAGLKIQNLEVDGLTWEDPDRYTKLISNAKSFDDWKYDTYHSLYEWRKRVDFLHTQVKVMIRLTEEPINPKYPAVHNKTFELK